MQAPRSPMPIPGRRALLAGAAASCAIAALHVAIPFAGAGWYRFFGAPALAAAVERGSTLRPAVMTFAFAAIFALWGLYAISAAGLVRRLPLLRTALVVVGTIYVLRGCFLIPQLLRIARHAPQEPRNVVFSVASLLIGLCYFVGAARMWDRLGARNGEEG